MGAPIREAGMSYLDGSSGHMLRQIRLVTGRVLRRHMRTFAVTLQVFS
jgi:hypothetical protein